MSWTFAQFCICLLTDAGETCRNLKIAEDNKDKAAQALKAKASAMAMALQTIGKFTIKKKVGQNNQIFGR